MPSGRTLGVFTTLLLASAALTPALGAHATAARPHGPAGAAVTVPAGPRAALAHPHEATSAAGGPASSTADASAAGGPVMNASADSAAGGPAAYTLAASAAGRPAAYTLAAGGSAGSGSAGSGGTGRLRWGPCEGAADEAVRCAGVRVPLDHRRPEGRAITIVISRLPATDPARRRGVLLTTGGGPGGPGVPLPAALAPWFSAEVRARYDLIGFDMRFVERSTPIGCGQAAEEPGGFWVRTATPGSFGADAAAARRYAEDCARAAGWALPYATTANAARDMDLIRAALGESRISYIGGSYAGMLGATYSTLFPGRVDRFVLDSPVNGDIAWRPFELARTPGFETGLTAFAAWTAERDDVYGLGGTTEAVVGRITALLDRAGHEPIVAGGHAWTAGELGFLLVAAVYYEHYSGLVAAALADVSAGREPVVPFPVRPLPPEGVPGVPVDNHTAVSTAFRCADGPWPRDLGTYRRDLAVYTERYPLFGPANANITPCAFWPRVQAERVPPARDRAPGALVLAALGDVAVPVSVSRSVAARIHGSRLVTVNARTHAPFPYHGDPCLNDTVNRYLATGALPPADIAC